MSTTPSTCSDVKDNMGVSTRGEVNRPERLTKDDTYLALAWWVQECPLAKDPHDGDQYKHYKVGAVIATPEKIILGIDCTQEDGLHPVQNILSKYHQTVKGCDLFMSRPPCVKCALLITQAGVRKVIHLPFMNEKHPVDNEDKEKREIDHHFRVSGTGISEALPAIPPSLCQKTLPTNLEGVLKDMSLEPEVPSIDAENSKQIIEKERQLDYKQALQWLVHTVYTQVPEGGCFIEFKTGERPPEPLMDIILHTLRMACILATRSDDPDYPCGTVLIRLPSEEDPYLEYLSFGWSGYPMNALKYNYPVTKEEKASSIAHATMNAYMFCPGDKDLSKCVAVVSRIPCSDCIRVLRRRGVKTVYCKSEEESVDRNTEFKGVSVFVFQPPACK